MNWSQNRNSQIYLVPNINTWFSPIRQFYLASTGLVVLLPEISATLDSLHQQSQARFNPNDWYNDTVIIDECDQVFWHLLNSGTEVSSKTSCFCAEKS
jgi:hypothetical protein